MIATDRKKEQDKQRRFGTVLDEMDALHEGYVAWREQNPKGVKRKKYKPVKWPELEAVYWSHRRRTKG